MLSWPAVLEAVSSVVDELSGVSLVVELDCELVVSVDEEDDEELVPWSASMLVPGCALS